MGDKRGQENLTQGRGVVEVDLATHHHPDRPGPGAEDHPGL